MYLDGMCHHTLGSNWYIRRTVSSRVSKSQFHVGARKIIVSSSSKGRERVCLPHLWVLRHGYSLANDAGLIVSHPSNGVLLDYGLAPEGFNQARRAGKQLKDELQAEGLDPKLLRVICSPFSRTVQTADTVRQVLGTQDSADVAFELRERFFGTELELGPHTRYDEVWARDALDVNHPAGGDGESVQEVARRVAELLRRLEDQDKGQGVLLVAHGDVLQITQAYIAGGRGLEHLGAHRKFGMDTGELRRVLSR